MRVIMNKTQNKIAPNFKIPSTNSKLLELKKVKSKYKVLYFYPKDMTPGCTTESIEFNENITKIRRAGWDVVGVSRDSLKSHEKFIEKHGFKFHLISDPDEKIRKVFDVIKEKSLYGRKYMGIDRSTFLIDRKSKLLGFWNNVKVKGHVDEVIEKIKELNK